MGRFVSLGVCIAACFSMCMYTCVSLLGYVVCLSLLINVCMRVWFLTAFMCGFIVFVFVQVCLYVQVSVSLSYLLCRGVFWCFAYMSLGICPSVLLSLCVRVCVYMCTCPSAFEPSNIWSIWGFASDGLWTHCVQALISEMIVCVYGAVCSRGVCIWCVSSQWVKSLSLF